MIPGQPSPMETDSSLLADRTWARTAAICGVAAIVSYGLLIAVPAPEALQVLLTFAFGFGLTLASLGLYFCAAAPASPRIALVAVVSNALAAALLVAMILVQMAAKSPAAAAGVSLSPVYLGLDVAWDLYAGVGTLGFAAALSRHPAFGPLFGWPGIAVAVGLLGLNIATFPTPPGEAGLVDLGPAVALWYVAVSIQLARRLRRARGPAWT